MKRIATLLALVAGIASLVLTAGWMTVPGDQDFTGWLNLRNWKVDGTEVTSSAAELNALDGITAAVGDLNSISAGADAKAFNGFAVTNLDARDITRTSNAQTVTSLQAIATCEGVVVVANAGAMTTTTNLLIAARTNNILCIIKANALNTNDILIADGTTATLNGDWTASANEWLLLYANQGVWNEIQRSEATAGAGLSATKSIGTQAVVFVNGIVQSVGP